MDARPGSYQTSVFRAQPTEGLQRKIQKRNRPPVSCLLCRTRKVKCDRQQPCERCVKSGEANFCEYAPRASRKSRSDSRPQVDTRARHEPMSRPVLQVRLQKLEEMVNGLVCTARNRDVNLDTPSSSDQRTETNESRSDLSSPPSLAPSAGQLHTTLGDHSYVGATHWASILESIHDIQGILQNESDGPPTPSPPPEQSSPDSADLVFGKVQPITLQQAITRLPPKNKTDALILVYFRHKFMTAPYIHTTKFQREYDAFWEDPSSASLLWISCLASMLWVAASISIMKGESEEFEAHQPEKLAVLATECLVSGDYLSAKPYSIEALLLLSYTELQRNRDIDSSLWAKFGLVARLAQRMGYHRDPKYLTNISPFQGELRRRAFFFIEVFDVLFSFQLGMPPIIRDDECDTESPSNLFDSDFDENVLSLPPARPSTEPTPILYLSYKSKLCRLLRRVIRFALSLQPPPYEEILKLDDEITQYHDQVPPSLQIKPIRSYSFTDQTYDIMHRLMLELMYLKSLCVLHRPYLNRDKDNPRYDKSRNICRDAALRILDLHAEYEEESRPGGRIHEDKYMLSALTLHDFLIASMIICLDLTENFPSTSADRSRKLKALGTSFRMWSDRKHTSKDAAHATRVVGSILRKVSMQEPATNRSPPPPPKPDVRDGSLASLLNNDSQPNPVPSPAPFEPVITLPPFDFSSEFLNNLPLDTMLNGQNTVDWSVIDQFLLDRPNSGFRTLP
ncbi:fungal-specific transcription factor domain-containing protein [Hypoxylon trugodes]|uniref:fungal-specific transcription factor domain-containing protein n=1 Tax=Hypoxylon trugodes TaxID=326681 RepID=UPI0021A1363B|nr:fungal-specific transcription factor domain-containing protein [Hypoxylon trugodes]KAI1389484.1 fungal-specific transcription factor domain-containing protein [Hypoxylon trugodes]